MATAGAITLRDEYLQIIEGMGGDREGRAAADVHLRESYAKGESLRWATNPLIFDIEQLETLTNAAATFDSIMEKVMAKYHRDAAFRKLFGLTREVEILTRVPSGCHAAVPLARLDIYYGQKAGNFKIAGVATGGIEGMAANLEATRAVMRTGAYKAFAGKHNAIETFDPLTAGVEAVLHTYISWANAEEGRNHPTNPSFAIVDVADSPRAAETVASISRLQEIGCYARATDLASLRIETVGGLPQLVDEEGPITCVWMRATADEAIAVKDGLKALVEATRRGLVCTVGGYRSWPCCVRNFFSVLRTKECRAILSDEENAFVEAHIPDTYVLDASLDLSQFYDQENWVLKEMDGLSLTGIHAGTSMRKADWRKALVKGIKHHHVVQAYIPQEKVRVAGADLAGEPFVLEENVMLSLFIFEGQLAGVGARCGIGGASANWSERLEMGALVVCD